ncbi:hypothetical protein, partial [Pseudomonas marginalis]|uniref:hypothetical protein n=1 Tax=Pseudomonas marginalis TaxID=298 RepID=UPI001F16A059
MESTKNFGRRFGRNAQKKPTLHFCSTDALTWLIASQTLSPSAYFPEELNFLKCQMAGEPPSQPAHNLTKT